MQELLLNSVNTNKVLIVMCIVAVLAIVFALLIVLISKLCAVDSDEKADAVQEHLAGANCGGCGFAGCGDFAKALAQGKANINDCGATSPESKREIANILGIPFASSEPKSAVVKCAGGILALNKYNYVGNEGCKAQNALMGGKKLCPTACLGEGTCLEKCANKAITVKNEVAVVSPELCTSCGVCVKECPKHIIELIPKKAVVYVACSSVCKGKEVTGACKIGCIGCGLCAKNCPENAISIINNLAVIDYSKCSGCKTCVAKCPRKCIKEYL